MTLEQVVCERVVEEPCTTATTATAALGAKTLNVDWTGEFTTTQGGQGLLLVDGQTGPGPNGTYAYTAVDDTETVITLATGLVAALTDVAITITACDANGLPTRELLAYCSTAGDVAAVPWRVGSDTDAKVTVNLPAGTRLWGDPDTKTIVTLVERSATIDGSQLVNVPDPTTVAPAAPASSPAITNVRSFASGVGITVEPFLPSTLVDFYVDGVLALANQRTNYVVITANSAGNPMSGDDISTQYAITTRAHNTTGDANSTNPAASAAVLVKRDLGYPDANWFFQLLTSTLTAQNAVIGGMSFGADGITIYDTSGRIVVRLPSDGSGPSFAGTGIFDSIVVQRLLIAGVLNYLQGKLVYAAGVTDPTDKPSAVAAGWDTHSTTLGYQPRGLYDNGTTWLYCENLFGGRVWSLNKTGYGRAVLSPDMPSKVSPLGGVTKLGASYYVLCYDGNDSTWKVRIYNATWTYTGGYTIPYSPPNVPVIANDGTNLLIARCSTSGLRITTNTPATGVELTNITCAGSWTADLTSVTKTTSAATLGSGSTVRYVVSSASEIRVFDSTGASKTAAEGWPVANTITGLSYDGANWHSAYGADDGSAAAVYDYTNLVGSTDLAYSDANTGSSYETGPSAIRTVVMKRQKWTIGGTAPTDASITAIRIYAAPTGSSLVRQATITAAPWSQTFSTFALTGSGTAANNFPTGNAGSAESSAKDTSAKPYWAQSGDGKITAGAVAFDPTAAVQPKALRARDAVPLHVLYELSSSSVASITNNTTTTVVGWSANNTNPGYQSALSGGLITIAAEGLYLVTASIVYSASAGTRARVGILKNGTPYQGVFSDAPSTATSRQTSPFISLPVYFDVGDTVGVATQQVSGASLALQGGHLWSLVRMSGPY